MSRQLSAQQIYFPAAKSAGVAGPEFAAMPQYGGQQLTTGAQAEVYADHFIANHLVTAGGGQTYAQLATEAQADPTNAKRATQVDIMFKGGLLLNAYAFAPSAGSPGSLRSWPSSQRVSCSPCACSASATPTASGR